MIISNNPHNSLQTTQHSPETQPPPNNTTKHKKNMAHHPHPLVLFAPQANLPRPPPTKQLPKGCFKRLRSVAPPAPKTFPKCSTASTKRARKDMKLACREEVFDVGKSPWCSVHLNMLQHENNKRTAFQPTKKVI